jgi:hypothetical protein
VGAELLAGHGLTCPRCLDRGVPACSWLCVPIRDRVRSAGHARFRRGLHGHLHAFTFPRRGSQHTPQAPITETHGAGFSEALSRCQPAGRAMR